MVEAEVERPKRKRLVAVVVAFILIAGGLLSWLWPWGPDIKGADPGKLAHALPDKPSIAVLPFVNMSTDKEQDYFSDGISEDINTDLTKISGLFVAPRTTMRRYQGKALDLRQLSNEVGARYILEGSVRRAQDRLRISAQLYDAKTDQQVWAERYDRDIKDLFTVQDDISEKVVAALSAKFATRTLTRVARTYTPNVDAYDLYIRGRATRIPPTPDNLAAASKLFEKAIALDPGFSGGYAGASFTNVLRYGHCSNSCERFLDAALEMANKAVGLDPGFGPGYGSLAEVLFRRNELDDALTAIQKAVEAAPNDSLMRASYGRILGHAGRFEEGIQQVKQAMRMSPDSLPHLYYLGSIYRVAGRFEDAIDALREHRKRLGDRVLPAPTAQLAAAYMQSGRGAEARATVQELLQAVPRFSVAQASRMLGFKSTKDSAPFLEALRNAGLPDH
jgi:adenylate cyclase